MNELMTALLKRLIQRYNDLIKELREVHDENRSMVDNMNKSPDSLEKAAWASAARENLRRLQQAEAERENLNDQLKELE